VGQGVGGQIIVFGKGGKTRSIQQPESVWKQLQRWRGKAAAEDPVFPSRKKGKPLTESAIWRIVKRDAADVLGNSPNIIEKHYGKWCPHRQRRISGLMDSIFGVYQRGVSIEKGTKNVHGEVEA
jgi:hypothetical protein